MELLHIALRNDWDTFTGLSLTDKFEILLIESDHFHLNKRMITFRCCYEELDIINEIPDEKRFVKLRLELNDIRKIMKLRHDERGTAWIIANGKFGLTILNILTDEFGYDATIENPETEFVTAVRSGENFLVSQLIKNYGIDINKPSFTCDFPALRYSVNINRPEMVKLLLSLGADIEGSENPHGSPLYEACLWGRIECAKILIDAGANLNYQARWRDTD